MVVYYIYRLGCGCVVSLASQQRFFFSVSEFSYFGGGVVVCVCVRERGGGEVYRYELGTNTKKFTGRNIE